MFIDNDRLVSGHLAMELEDDIFDELFSAVQQPDSDAVEAAAQQAKDEQSLFDDFFTESSANKQDGDKQDEAIGVAGNEHSQALAQNHLYGDPHYLRRLGNGIQQKMYNQFLRYVSKHETLPEGCARQSGDGLSWQSQMTDLVLDNFLESSTLKSVATVAESTGVTAKLVRSYLLRCAACMVYGSSWLVGAGICGWRALFRSGRFAPILLVHKQKYDETPLKMQLCEYNRFLGEATTGEQHAMKNDSRFCKILRLEWVLGFLVLDRATGRHKFITTNIPVPLTAISRNTAECLAGVINHTMARIPEIKVFETEFEQVVRLASIDRYTANFKCEKYMKSNSEKKMISTLFTCDVHKYSGCIKKGLALSDETLSGLVNLALSMEAAGCVSQMRGILQRIFSDELVIALDYPPGKESETYQHRMAILDLFLPGKSPKDLKRRFVLQSLANSDLTSDEVVHWCPFGCCGTPERALAAFQRWVVWALVPSKMKVLNRKSWTGSDSAVQWAGLLHSHWGLLPRIVIKMIRVDRPLVSQKGSVDDPVGRDQPVLVDDPAVQEMEEFNLLLQDCLFHQKHALIYKITLIEQSNKRAIL